MPRPSVSQALLRVLAGHASRPPATKRGAAGVLQTEWRRHTAKWQSWDSNSDPLVPETHFSSFYSGSKAVGCSVGQILFNQVTESHPVITSDDVTFTGVGIHSCNSSVDLWPQEQEGL